MGKVSENISIQSVGYIFAAVFSVGATAFLILRYILFKFLDKFEKLQQKVADLDTQGQLMVQKILHLTSDVSHLDGVVGSTNSAISKLNETLGKFSETLMLVENNNNMRHRDSAQQVAEMKTIMDRSNNLMVESAKTNTELMGVLKDLKKS